uniref:Uncharacterized protein n=1 Tax=Mesocestoides corti TaxID=53468 RepID=A0A5K3FEG7_MESCO
MKKTGITGQAILTNHMPDPNVGTVHPSSSRWPRRPLYTAPHLCLLVWLPIFHRCLWYTERQRTG